MKQSERIAIDKFCTGVNLVFVLDHGGRAGSNFFQCLFDAHEELIICPLVHYVYSYLHSIFGDKDEVYLQEAHEFIAHTSYFRFLYHDLEGEYKEIVRKIGGDETAPFDRVYFRSLVDDLFAGEGMITRRDIITRAYAAYALCRGFDLKKVKYIGFNDAISTRGEDLRKGFSASTLDKALQDFPDVVYLPLLRDPRAQYASTRHQMVNEFGNNYGLRPGNWLQTWKRLWNNDISLDHGPAHFCLMYQVAAFRALIKKWREGKGRWLFLRNEDFNTNFVPTMTALCKQLNIEPDLEWLEKGDDYKARMMGRPWAGTGAYSSRYQKVTNGPLSNDKPEDVVKMVGPNKYVTERWKTRIPRYEQAILEGLFHHEIQYFRYPVIIPDDEKVSWKIILKQFLPWSGEWPTFKWLFANTNKTEANARLFYFLTVWPLYLLSRYKLFIYAARDQFFNEGFNCPEEVSTLPFVGNLTELGLSKSIDHASDSTMISDSASLSLLFEVIKSRVFKKKKITIILIEPDKRSLLVKLLGHIASIENCGTDLGDYINETGVHLFADREGFLLQTYNDVAQ